MLRKANGWLQVCVFLPLCAVKNASFVTYLQVLIVQQALAEPQLSLYPAALLRPLLTKHDSVRTAWISLTHFILTGQAAVEL